MVFLKEVIRKKIDEMDELEDRNILKAIVEDVFKGVVAYQKNFNKQLEDRLFNQFEDKEKDYDLYTTIIARDKLKVVNDFLTPILKEDQTALTQENILARIKAEEKEKIAQVFIAANYENIKELAASNRIFTGEVVTETNSYQITFSLEYNRAYIQKEEELYNIFNKNNLKWKTVNNPYGRKIFDIIVIDYQEGLNEIDEYQKIKFDFEEFEVESYLDYIPVWNIKKTYQKGEGFPVPAEDKINYDHFIAIENLNPTNGYLVIPDGNNITSVKRKKDKIIISSSQSNSKSWGLLEIIQDSREIDREFSFKLLSNSRKDFFINRFINNNFNHIKTRAELNRIINSYYSITDIKLEEIEITNNITNETTYDFNQFIKDEIRAKNFKQIMLLKFSGGVNDYLKYDLLSFLLSEIQNYFPEYLCKGVFIK